MCIQPSRITKCINYKRKFLVVYFCLTTCFFTLQKWEIYTWWNDLERNASKFAIFFGKQVMDVDFHWSPIKIHIMTFFFNLCNYISWKNSGFIHIKKNMANFIASSINVFIFLKSLFLNSRIYTSLYYYTYIEH